MIGQDEVSYRIDMETIIGEVGIHKVLTETIAEIEVEETLIEVTVMIGADPEKEVNLQEGIDSMVTLDSDQDPEADLALE